MQIYGHQTMGNTTKNIDNKLIIIISSIIRIALIIAFAGVIIHMLIGMFDIIIEIIKIPANTENLIYPLIDIIVEDSLLTVVIFEIYESIIDFFNGKDRTISDIINAAISFVAREIILIIFTVHIYNNVDTYHIIALSILIVALALTHYILSLGNNK